MPTVAEMLEQAAKAHETGNLPAVEQLCRQVLQLDPDQPDALHRLGLLACQVGKDEQAVELLKQSLARQPQQPACLFNLAIAYCKLTRFDEAIASFREVLRWRPSFAEAHNQLAAILLQKDQPSEAIAHGREAVRLQPANADGHHNLGAALARRGLTDEAIAAFREALRRQPNFPAAHANLGRALVQQRKLDEAVASFQEALRLQPDFAIALNDLGIALYDLLKLDEAVACYREALRLNPQDPFALNNLGVALAAQGRLDEALASFREAVQLRPDLRLVHTNLVMHLNYDPIVDRAALFAEHQRWADIHAHPPAKLAPYSNDRNPDRPLRIGYVSVDFRPHLVAPFLAPIMTHHDPTQFEIFFYSIVRIPEPVPAPFHQRPDGWRYIGDLNDADVAEQVRRDRIDILVDLAGHTPNNRLGVFALKPAPVQVTYLGYPNTTGLSTIDYRLTDAVADPPGEPIHHTEQLVRLPDCFCCYWCQYDVAEPGPLPADRNGHVTFASLHVLFKLNPKVLDAWAAAMRALPTSCLLIYRDALTGSTQDRLRKAFAERGVDPVRLDLRCEAPAGQDHWSVYQEADLSLDPFPWTGHHTGCESLWAGVPMVTMRGNRNAARMVASVLTTLGMTDWIAETPEQYVDLIVAKAKDLDALRALRAGLRERMRASPLCDGPRFTRGLESAYREMWRTWCASKK